MVDGEKLKELTKNRTKDVSSSHLITSSRVWLEVRDLMSRDVATVSPGQNLASAARIMAEGSVSSLVVVEHNRVVGIVTETDFLKKVATNGKSADGTKVEEVMSFPVISVAPDMSVLDAGKIAEEKQVKRLPVLDGDELIGIITQTDLIRVLTSYGMWRDIAEIMSRDVAVVQKNATVAEAAAVMSERNISGIVVMHGSEAAGVITERDVLKKVIAAGMEPAQVRAEEIMSFPVISVPPHFSVFSSSRIMDKMHVRRLVVEDNKRLRGIVTQTDIFRAVEDRLKGEEENNFKLLEGSETSVYTLDLEDNVTYVNPALMKLLEVEDRAELINRPFLPERFWFNRQDRKHYLKKLKKGTVEIKDLTLKSAAGKRIDVTLFCSFTRNMHGQINGSQGVLQDITDKKELVALKEAESALRASEERYRHITEAVTDYIFSVRFEDDKPVEAVDSAASVAVTGYTPEELNASPNLWFNIVHPEDWEAVRQQVSQCISGQDMKPIEHRIVRKDGSVRWVRRTLVRNYDARGALVSYDGLLQDITDIKLAEQVQLQMLGELERTTQELRDFAHIASHDLKAPLRGISALAGWISTDYSDKLDEEGKERIQLLLARVRRMYNLIDGVLQYSRVIRSEEKRSKVDLNEVVCEVIECLAPPSNVKVEIEKKLPVIVCGESAIKQVFSNLLSNAINYMDKPEGRIGISWAERRDFWKFSVADNGPGIEEKHFGKIFKIFQTLAPRDQVESTGVGLTVARKIVELCGGRIWLQSKRGEGSTFFFTVPKEAKRLERARLLVGVAQ